MRACLVCGTASLESRCALHARRKPAWVKKRPGSYGWAWREKRKQVLLEEPHCRYCDAPSTEVDHIVPKAEGGTDARSNLQGICKHHHRIKTKGESERGRRRAV